MIKIAIFSNYGLDARTSDIADIYAKNRGLSDVELRMKIAELIENNAVESEIVKGDFDTWMKKHQKLFVHIRDTADTSIYCCYDMTTHWVSEISVVAVDTTVPWKIGNYDGAEYVKYRPKLIPVEERYNRYDWK